MLDFNTFRMMTILRIAGLAIWMCSAPGLFSQTATDRVKQCLFEQQAAWNRGDIAGFMAHYWKDDSLKFIGSKGVTYGWQKTFDNYVKAYPSQEAMGQLTFTLIEVSELSPEAVFVVGQWHLEKEKPVGGHFTLLWRKINAQWVIVADHTS